jgi:hypothetical protein
MDIEWKYKGVAAEVPHDFPVMHTKDNARILVELHEDNGPEAWRQFARRFDPIGDTFVIDRMDRLMNVARCKNMLEIPASSFSMGTRTRRVRVQVRRRSSTRRLENANSIQDGSRIGEGPH